MFKKLFEKFFPGLGLSVETENSENSSLDVLPKDLVEKEIFNKLNCENQINFCNTNTEYSKFCENVNFKKKCFHPFFLNKVCEFLKNAKYFDTHWDRLSRTSRPEYPSIVILNNRGLRIVKYPELTFYCVENEGSEEKFYTLMVYKYLIHDGTENGNPRDDVRNSQTGCDIFSFFIVDNVKINEKINEGEDLWYNNESGELSFEKMSDVFISGGEEDNGKWVPKFYQNFTMKEMEEKVLEAFFENNFLKKFSKCEIIKENIRGVHRTDDLEFIDYLEDS